MSVFLKFLRNFNKAVSYKKRYALKEKPDEYQVV